MPSLRTRALIVTSSTLFLSALVWYNYSAVLPLLVDEWGLTGTRAGIIFGSFQAGYLLAILPMGRLADRYSPRWIVCVGATGTGLASVGFALLAVGFWSGTGLRFLSGLFMAGVYVPGMRFLSDWYPAAHRGRALGLYVGSFSMGSALSFLATAAIADVVDWRTAIAATSVGVVAIAPLVLGLTRDHPDAVEREAVAFDLSILRNREFLSAVSAYSWHNWELLGARNWLLAFLLATPAFAATGSGVLAGTVAAVWVAMSGVGNAFGGWASDRIGRGRTIATGLIVSGSISAVLGFLGWLPLWLLVVLLVVYGVSLSVDSAPTSTLVTEVVDDSQVGTALSIQSFVGFSTTVVSPVVFGLALDAAGWGPAFVTLAVGAFLGVASIGALRYWATGHETSVAA